MINTVYTNWMNMPPIDKEALLAMGQEMMRRKDVSDKIMGAVGNMMIQVAQEDEMIKAGERAYQEYKEKEKNGSSYLYQACSYYCAPLIDFASEQFDLFVNLYYDSKAFEDEELKSTLNTIWRLLADEHAKYYEMATNKEFYEAYRMHCKDYLRQRYNKLVTRFTSIYRQSGKRQCKIAAMLSALNAVVVMSDTARQQIGDKIRDQIGTKSDIDDFSMKNVNDLLSHLIRKMEYDYLVTLKPNVNKYLEEFYTQIYVKRLVSYGLMRAKKKYRKEGYDACLLAIDIFGDDLFN